MTTTFWTTPCRSDERRIETLSGLTARLVLWAELFGGSRNSSTKQTRRILSHGIGVFAWVVFGGQSEPRADPFSRSRLVTLSTPAEQAFADLYTT